MRTVISEKELRNFISLLRPSEPSAERPRDLPKISVVIPSFNDGVFLERAIVSVLNQHYPKSELIIIDGGSSDGTLEIIKKYETHLSYWVSEKDNGESDALNKGFSAASGELVNEMNADDVLLPGALLAAGRFFRNCRDVDVIFGDMLNIDEHDAIIGECVYTKFSPVIYQYEGPSLAAQSAFWKRSLFGKVGWYDLNLRFSMDYDFFLRVARSGAKFRRLPYFFSAMRRHEGSLTQASADSPERRAELAELDRRYGKRRELIPLLRAYAQAYRIFHYLLQGDGDYVAKGFLRRLKEKKAHAGH